MQDWAAQHTCHSGAAQVGAGSSWFGLGGQALSKLQAHLLPMDIPAIKEDSDYNDNHAWGSYSPVSLQLDQ
jgi:hypothetical protein